MMKVIYDGVIFEKQRIGGISRVFSEIIPRVAGQSDIEATILTTKAWKNEFQYASTDARRVALPDLRKFLRPDRMFRRYYSFIDQALRSTYSYMSHDIWHSTEYTVPLFNIPSVVTIHDMIPEIFPEYVDKGYVEYARNAKSIAVAKADVVIAVSNNTRDDIVDYYDNIDESKIKIVSNAYNKDVFYPKKVKRQKFILYVGGRSKYKGFDLLRECLNEWENMSDYSLVVVGPKMISQEREACNFSVESVSNITDAELSRLYASASAFVYPSLYEGFGIPILEATACHCPVVASDIPTSREISAAIPYYFDQGDKRQLLQALKASLDRVNWHRRLQMGDHLLPQYSWEKTASETVSVYRSLVG